MDPKSYIKKNLKGSKVLYLSTCCVGEAKLDVIEAEVDEALATGTWVDIKVKHYESYEIVNIIQCHVCLNCS